MRTTLDFQTAEKIPQNARNLLLQMHFIGTKDNMPIHGYTVGHWDANNKRYVLRDPIYANNANWELTAWAYCDEMSMIFEPSSSMEEEFNVH